MKQRDFIDTNECTDQQITDLMNLALALKTAEKAGYRPRLLADRTVGLLLPDEPDLLRFAYEQAILRLGAFPRALSLSFDPERPGLAVEPLARLCDCLVVRGERYETLLLLAKQTALPVVNAGSTFNDPVQELADLITMYEHLPREKRLEQCKLVFDGPASPICSSMLFIATKMGVGFTQVAEKSAQLTPPLLKIAERNVKRSGGVYGVTELGADAYRDADFLRTESVSPDPNVERPERPFWIDPFENHLTAIRAVLVRALYDDPLSQDGVLIEKLRRTLSAKLHAVFGYGLGAK